ncbi:hypothetical protein IID24_02890 [Patescibacteria group bacterium]|nr:hypothetical protein [Patescibacteria group bacterium]
MDEQQILQKLKEMEEKLDEVYKSTERTRKYILWMFILSILVIVLPLAGLVFIIPQFLSLYGDLGSLGL